MKKIVQYWANKGIQPFNGCMLVYPMDHPDAIRVSNEKEALTSKVVSHDTETGIFETMNTIYKPYPPKVKQNEPTVCDTDAKDKQSQQSNA